MKKLTMLIGQDERNARSAIQINELYTSYVFPNFSIFLLINN